MTEAEWLACDDPTPMLEFLRDKVSGRKLRLFAVACCRQAGPLLDRDRNALAHAERYADCVVTREDHYDAWWKNADGEIDRIGELGETVFGIALQALWADELAVDLFDAALDICHVARLPEEQAALVQILNDLVDLLPFRAIAIEPAWLTSTVVALAETIYTDRAFDRLPILADALEDAGCTNRDILDHCRQPGEHARGCWVVDLVLGKE